MKKYVKPSLKSLGLLRVVTQYSCDRDRHPTVHSDFRR
jgi:hypothetical protein